MTPLKHRYDIPALCMLDNLLKYELENKQYTTIWVFEDEQTSTKVSYA